MIGKLQIAISQIGKYSFSSSSRGFIRSGVGQSMDTLNEYVEKSIQTQKVNQNLETLTTKYLEAITSNDRIAISQLTKKNLNDKTVEWMNEVAKKGEQFQIIGKDNPSSSLQGFTSYSYLYGLRNEIENKEFEKWRIYNLNKNFLVKRLLFIEGFKVHKLFSKKSIAVEAYIYTNLRLTIKKESKQQQLQQQSQQQHQYTGYKVCYVCDGQQEQLQPFHLIEDDKKQVYKDENKQKLFELNGWKIADINDWVYGELQTQDFSKWVYTTVLDAPTIQTEPLKTTATK